MSLTNRIAVLVLTALVACLPQKNDRYSRKQAQKTLTKLETPGLVVGEFHVTKVSDGDTIRVDGLDASLRLLGLDTEETFDHYPQDRRDYESMGWQKYTTMKREGHAHP